MSWIVSSFFLFSELKFLTLCGFLILFRLLHPYCLSFTILLRSSLRTVKKMFVKHLLTLLQHNINIFAIQQEFIKANRIYFGNKKACLKFNGYQMSTMSVVEMFVPTILLLIFAIRAFVVLYLDLNVCTPLVRLMLFTEYLPANVRKQVEMLLLVWSMFYVLHTLYASNRYILHYKFLTVSVCGDGDDDQITPEDLGKILFANNRMNKNICLDLDLKDFQKIKRLRNILAIVFDRCVVFIVIINVAFLMSRMYIHSLHQYSVFWSVFWLIYALLWSIYAASGKDKKRPEDLNLNSSVNCFSIRLYHFNDHQCGRLHLPQAI